MAAMTSGVAQADGAELYFERRGSGPALLLIVGGGGDCGYFGRLGDALADEYTVLAYDRRGNSRSRLSSPPRPLVMAEQSADALAVLRANGFDSGLVFGNSGGASVALDLAAHHPGAVEAVVCHEPPVPTVLTDGADYLSVFDEIDRLLAVQGWEAAFTHFQVTIGNAPPPVVAMLFDPAGHLPPGSERDRMMRTSGNWEYLTRYEVRPFIDYRPDLERIAANGVRIALGHGAVTDHAAAVRMSAAVAERLGGDSVEFPGGHTGPLEVPGAFATTLRGLLRRLS
jgi:pimeloyl-ACP methyl ester carboxylesterase